jgi:hypothetical protein
MDVAAQGWYALILDHFSAILSHVLLQEEE